MVPCYILVIIYLEDNMRKLVFCLLALMLPVLPLLAATWYSGSTGYLNSLNTWWSNPDESGSHPYGFTFSGQLFVVQSGHTKTANAEWTVSGTGSYVLLETDAWVTTGNFNHDIDVRMEAGSTYEVTYNRYSSTDLLQIDPASTFILNNASIVFRDNYSYGNLIVRNGTADMIGTSTYNILGQLTVESGGTFEGGQSSDHTVNIGSVVIDGGAFYGSVGSANVTLNIDGDLTINGSGSLYGSDGSGATTFNIGGNLTGGTYAWFYACYRSGTYDLPNTTYNIAGNLSVPGSNYVARNREAGGYPSFHLSGANKSLALGSATSTASCQHNIYINTGASYTLTQNVSVGRYCQLRVDGTLKGENYQIKNYDGYDPTINIYGTFYTKRASGLVGSSSDAFSLASPAYLVLQSGCHIKYDAAGDQVISPLSGYQSLSLLGSGSKTLSSTGATVQNYLTVSAPLVIATSGTMMLIGDLTATSTITGGNLYIAGSGARINLPQCTLDNFTLNRANGCILTGYFNVEHMTLTSGTLYIDNRTMQIRGDVSYGSGSINGTGSSFLVIGGTGNMFSLRTITLGTLTVGRPNGCILAGNVVTGDLNLTSGTLNISSYSLQINGTLSITSGSLAGTGSSTLVLAGTGDMTLPALTLGTLNNSRNGTCRMGGNLSVGILTLNSGTFNIYNSTLTINTRLVRSSGIFTAGYTSTLAYTSSSYQLGLPAINLSRLDLNSSQGCALEGTLNVYHLNLQNGNLNLRDYSAKVMSSLANSGGTISGTAVSILEIAFNVVTGVDMPQLAVGTLILSGNMNYRFSAASRVLTQLRLGAGTLSPGSYLSLATMANIDRRAGSFTAAPTFEGTISISYSNDTTAGYEIPTGHSVLTSLILNAGVDIESDRDIHVTQSLVLRANAILTMDEGTLYLPAGYTYTSEAGSLVVGGVSTSISGGGFDFRLGDIVIGGGISIPDFSSVLAITPQELQNGPSINRVWDLSGSFTGTATLTFEWASSADNGLGFSAENRACVMRRVGENWVHVGDPVDVSEMEPRSVSVQTTGFSQWTIGSETSTLPVTLSSFTAVPNQMNYVLLSWTTQSESNLVGFRLLRGEQQNLAAAADLNVLVPATNTSTLQNYTYTDSEVTPPAQYYYWLAAVELDGTLVYSDPVMVLLQDTQGPDAPPAVGLPLISAYPNPFNPILNLRVAHRDDGWLRLELFNQRGQKVRLLREGELVKGLYYLEWDGRDDAGHACGSGVYLLRCGTAYEEVWTRVSLQK